MNTMRNDALSYLDPAVLAGMDNLELVAKFIVEGFIIGLHRSPYHGFSSEFSSYRKYVEGDDPKFVDWRIFARTERFYIKEFEETTNLTCHIVLDASASMGFADEGGVSKLEYGRYLCAGLSYLMLRQRDSVSLATFSGGRHSFVPPSARSVQLNNILLRLAETKPGGTTDLGQALSGMAERIRGRSLIVVVSDFLSPMDEIKHILRHFRYRHHEVILFQALTRSEAEFPFQAPTCFKDMETGQEVFTEPAHIREAYLRLLGEHEDALLRQCSDLDVDFVRLGTDQNLGPALVAYLARRAAAV